MHELSLVQELLALIARQAAEHGFARVNLVKLSCGRLSSVEPRALEFAFETLKVTSLCAQAALELKIIPLKIYCFACERDLVSAAGDPTLCPACGGGEVIISDGLQELQLVELDVD